VFPGRGIFEGCLYTRRLFLTLSLRVQLTFPDENCNFSEKAEYFITNFSLNIHKRVFYVNGTNIVNSGNIHRNGKSARTEMRSAIFVSCYTDVFNKFTKNEVSSNS